MAAADRNWIHDPRYDDATMAEFERRLARSRSSSRAGYLRVKGATLLKAGDPSATRVAIGLLTRVVEQYDHFLEVPWSHELLGEAYQQAGNLGAAERHLRLCLETADERRNGTTKVTELSLAEVLLAQGRVDEAGELLALDDLRRNLLWKSQLFRFAVASARYEARTGGQPQPWAQRALKLAQDQTPQLPRHPGIGLARADAVTLAEMEHLAASA